MQQYEQHLCGLWMTSSWILVSPMQSAVLPWHYKTKWVKILQIKKWKHNHITLCNKPAWVQTSSCWFFFFFFCYVYEDASASGHLLPTVEYNCRWLQVVPKVDDKQKKCSWYWQQQTESNTENTEYHGIRCYLTELLGERGMFRKFRRQNVNWKSVDTAKKDKNVGKK